MGISCSLWQVEYNWCPPVLQLLLTAGECCGSNSCLCDGWILWDAFWVGWTFCLSSAFQTRGCWWASYSTCLFSLQGICRAVAVLDFLLCCPRNMPELFFLSLQWNSFQLCNTVASGTWTTALQFCSCWMQGQEELCSPDYILSPFLWASLEDDDCLQRGFVMVETILQSFILSPHWKSRCCPTHQGVFLVASPIPAPGSWQSLPRSHGTLQPEEHNYFHFFFLRWEGFEKHIIVHFISEF